MPQKEKHVANSMSASNRGRPSLKVALIGAFGNPNFGDQLILEITKAYIRLKFPKTILRAPFAYNQKEVGLNWFSSINHLLSADIAIFCGGGYFSDRGKPRIRLKRFVRYSFAAACVLFRRTPFIISAVGVDPLSRTPERILFGILAKKSQSISVRDVQSKINLEKVAQRTPSITIAADIVLSSAFDNHIKNKGIDYAPENQKSVQVALHLPTLFPKHKNRLFEIIRSLPIKSNLDREIQYYLLSDRETGWIESASECCSKHDLPHEIPPGTSIPNVLNLLSKVDFVVTSKLHVGIVAYKFGASPFGISSHPKTTEFYRLIGLPANQLMADASDSEFIEWKSLMLNAIKTAAPKNQDKQLVIRRKELTRKSDQNLSTITSFMQNFLK